MAGQPETTGMDFSLRTPTPQHTPLSGHITGASGLGGKFEMVLSLTPSFSTREPRSRAKWTWRDLAWRGCPQGEDCRLHLNTRAGDSGLRETLATNAGFP